MDVERILTESAGRRGYTQVDYERAATDAERVIADSPLVRHFLLWMTLCARLINVARANINKHLTDEWVVSKQPLVENILAQSAQHQIHKAHTVEELIAAVNQILLPGLNVMRQQGLDPQPEAAPEAPAEELTPVPEETSNGSAPVS